MLLSALGNVSMELQLVDLLEEALSIKCNDGDETNKMFCAVSDTDIPVQKVE